MGGPRAIVEGERRGLSVRDKVASTLRFFGVDGGATGNFREGRRPGS